MMYTIVYDVNQYLNSIKDKCDHLGAVLITLFGYISILGFIFCLQRHNLDFLSVLTIERAWDRDYL